MIADLHCHTSGGRGRGAVLDYVTVAMSRGLSAIAVTGRSPVRASRLTMGERDAGSLLDEVAEVARRSEGLRVLSAVECRVTSARGDLDVPAEVRTEFDLVLAGFGGGPLHWATRLHPGWSRRARIKGVEALTEAVCLHEIDVITNPGPCAAADIAELARACAANDTAIEISARHLAMTVEHCRIAAREGARFLLTSDAHHPREVGAAARAAAIARAAGLTPEQILNVETSSLFAWYERKKGRGPSFWTDWAEQPGAREEDGKGEARGSRDKSGWADWASQGKVH